MLRINRHLHHHDLDHANQRLNLDHSSSSSSVQPPPEIQASPSPSPPTNQLPAKPNTKLLSFLLQAFIMTLVLSLFFVFIGIAVIVFIHLCLVGGALHRRHRRYRDRSRPHDGQSGFSDAEIRSLPKFKIRPKSGQRWSETCPICLDNCGEGDWCRELPDCKHVFHAKCVDKWLAKASGCPVCRTTVRLTTRNKEETTGIGDCSAPLWYAFG